MGAELESLLKQAVEGINGLGTRVGGVESALSAVTTRVDTMERAALERRAGQRIPGLELEAKKFSIARVIRGIVLERHNPSRAWEGAEFEKAVLDEAAKKRDLAAGTDNLGGYLVPPEVLGEMIELLRAMTVVFESGATSLTGLVGSPVMIPKQTGGATGYWLGENGAPTKSDQAFGQINLVPKRASAFTKVSNRLIFQSSQAAEQIVRQDLAAVLARLVDLAALRGSGVDGEPKGVRNWGVTEKDIGGSGVPTFEHLYDMLSELEVANAPMNRLGIVTTPRLWNKYRKIRDAAGGAGTGMFMLAPNGEELQQGVRAMFAGIPIRTSSQIPTNLGGGDRSELYLGNWSDLIVGQWGGLEIKASDIAGDSSGSAFLNNQTWITINQEVDVAVRHAKSFVFADDLLVT